LGAHPNDAVRNVVALAGLRSSNHEAR
jgi:hypothetical protein